MGAGYKLFYDGSQKWVFRLEDDFTWHSGHDFRLGEAYRDFTSRDGKPRVRLWRDGRITIKAGYAWDGCSPKLFILDVFVGTPDGVIAPEANGQEKPKVYYASLVHDAMYQFLDAMRTAGVAVKRRDADRFFLRLMQERKFALSRIYYYAVRLFGGLFRALRGRVGKGSRY